MATASPSISEQAPRPELGARARRDDSPNVPLWHVPEGWLTVALLLVMVLSVVWSMDQARWVEGSGVLFSFALLGIGLGYLLSRSRLPGLVALPLGVLVGVAAVFLEIGRVVPPLGEAPGALAETLRGTVAWAAGGGSGSLPLAEAVRLFGDNAVLFAARIGTWFQLIISGRASNDNAIFLLLIAYVAWIQGLVGAWGIFRLRDVSIAAMPTGIALTTNTAYTGQAQAPFAMFLIALLLLAVSVNLAALQRRWERLGVDYPGQLLFDVVVSSFVVICLLAGLALVAPRLADNPLSNAFWTYLGEQWSEVETASSRMFSGVNSPATVGGGGKETLVLSGQVRLTQKAVMAVQSDEPYYWRGITYDTYTGRFWRNGDKLLLSRSEKQPVVAPRLLGRKRVKAGFEIQQSRSDLIYAPDEPVALSISYKLQTRTSDASVPDFSALHARRPAIPNLKYTVEAFASTAGAEDLRNATADYPDWVKRYLQLPDVPARVRDLSNALTRTRRNPYDKAVAVEQFIRRYRYSLDVRPPPEDRDAVEWFLFDAKEGYCDYMASSMVVLLRSQGIPARLATGYVAGKFDNVTRRFIVSEEEAHSWAEVYFPGYGWIPFEPSGYRPPIVRPEESTVSPYDGDYLDDYDDMYGEFGDLVDALGPGFGFDQGDAGGVFLFGRRAPRLPNLLPILLLALAGGGLYLAARSLGERRLPPHLLVRRTYQRMTHYGALFGQRRRPSQTPSEYARELTAGLQAGLSRDGLLRLEDWVEVPPTAAETIASAYVRAQYGQRTPSRDERDEVVQSWQELRWKFPLLLLRNRRIRE